jgi:hypothetical protein
MDRRSGYAEPEGRLLIATVISVFGKGRYL